MQPADGPPREPPAPLPLDALDLPAEEVAARFAWGLRQGHPHYVWPDVPMETWRACLGEIERVTREILTQGGAGRSAAARLAPPPGADAAALGIAAYTSGLGPLLGYWIARGALVAPADVSGLLGLHLEHGRLRWQRMASLLGTTLDTLCSAGLDVLVIKGAHTARSLFPDPGTRPASDVDLVVRPAELARAAAALKAAGFRTTKRQDRLGKWEMVPPGSGEVHRSLALNHADDPLGLDLHGTLDRTFFGVGRVRFGRPLPGETRPFPDLHPAASVPAGPLLPALLAAHASEGLHNLSMLRLVELVWALRGDGGGGAVDQEALERRLADAGGLRFVLPAFQLAEQLAPGTVEPAFLERLRAHATPATRRVVDGLRPADLPPIERLALDERMMWARGPLDHLRRLLDMLWPASAGDSPAAVLDIYRARVRRFARGRVTFGERPRG